MGPCDDEIVGDVYKVVDDVDTGNVYKDKKEEWVGVRKIK